MAFVKVVGGTVVQKQPYPGDGFVACDPSILPGFVETSPGVFEAPAIPADNLRESMREQIKQECHSRIVNLIMADGRKFDESEQLNRAGTSVSLLYTLMQGGTLTAEQQAWATDLQTAKAKKDAILQANREARATLDAMNDGDIRATHETFDVGLFVAWPE